MKAKKNGKVRVSPIVRIMYVSRVSSIANEIKKFEVQLNSRNERLERQYVEEFNLSLNDEQCF